MKLEGLAGAVRGGGVVLLVGERGRGKTTLLAHLVAALGREGIGAGGVLSPRIVVAGKKVGYLVRDIRTGREEVLCSLNPPGLAFRRFYFRREGIELGRRAILEAKGSPVLIVDEVGPLELTGEGFAPALREVLGRRVSGSTVIALRPWILDEVREAFGLADARVLTL